jgi:hypothetical protein
MIYKAVDVIIAIKILCINVVGCSNKISMKMKLQKGLTSIFLFGYN